jgi:cell division protein FtsL
VASWAPAHARAEAPALPRPRPKKRVSAKAAPRRRAFGGVAWIVLFGALLAGVVAINVAVLQLNVQLGKLGTERIQLRADTARLRSQLSSAGAAAEIEAQAKARLGLERADPETTSYVELPPRK